MATTGIMGNSVCTSASKWDQLECYHAYENTWIAVFGDGKRSELIRGIHLQWWWQTAIDCRSHSDKNFHSLFDVSMSAVRHSSPVACSRPWHMIHAWLWWKEIFSELVFYNWKCVKFLLARMSYYCVCGSFFDTPTHHDTIMCVCMCVCVFVHVCMCVYVNVCVCVCIEVRVNAKKMTTKINMLFRSYSRSGGGWNDWVHSFNSRRSLLMGRIWIETSCPRRKPAGWHGRVHRHHQSKSIREVSTAWRHRPPEPCLLDRSIPQIHKESHTRNPTLRSHRRWESTGRSQICLCQLLSKGSSLHISAAGWRCVHQTQLVW